MIQLKPGPPPNDGKDYIVQGRECVEITDAGHDWIDAVAHAGPITWWKPNEATCEEAFKGKQ